MKRQQAVEDAIALRLASNDTGTPMDTLPPGKIYGMNVTKPCIAPSTSISANDQESSSKSSSMSGDSNPITSPNNSNTQVSETAIDMLAQLFPHRKRSVLELVLRRCDSDLLRAIEQCSRTPSAFRPPTTTHQV